MSCGLIGSGCRLHQLFFCRGVRRPQQVSCALAGWGCRIHLLCRRVRFLHACPVTHFAGTAEYTNCFLQRDKTTLSSVLGPRWLGLSNTLTASLQRDKTPTPASVLDMTLNNLMVMFQSCWSFGKCEVSFIATAPRYNMAKISNT